MNGLAHTEATTVTTGEIHRIPLPGCTPAPLASYLKGLAVLRLVAEQADPDVRGWWEQDQFWLQSRLSMDELQAFFLHEYEPTPILSPWSGRAGFLEGEAEGERSTRKGAVILREVETSQAARFEQYRTLVDHARANDTLAEMDRIRAEQNRLMGEQKRKGVTAAEKAAIDERLKALGAREKALKDVLLASLRADLPEETVGWIDTCFAIADDIRAGALLGTGGNEGSMDFSINHLETLLKMFDKDTGEPGPGLEAALYGTLTSEAVRQWDGVNPGLLAPASLGGPNMGAGFEGALHENPWDAVLMLEGALLFSATVTRRHGASPGGGLSFPFALGAVNAGHGGVSRGETSRPEIWAPLWEAPATLDEVAALFAEGRMTVGRRPARNALDAARAVARLGADRGIRSFQRFGFYERRGQGYYVTVPLERRFASSRPAARLVDDIAGWLTQFRRMADAKGTPARLISLIRAVEDAVFRVTGGEVEDAQTVQSLLAALGAAQLYLADSPKAREVCPPVPRLSFRWVELANDESDEFRLALGLAALHGFRSPTAGSVSATLPMAIHLAPLKMLGVDRERGTVASESPEPRSETPRTSSDALNDQTGQPSTLTQSEDQMGKQRTIAWRPTWEPTWDTTSKALNRVVWGPGSLDENLGSILQRRVLEADVLQLIDKPFASTVDVSMHAVAGWLHDELDRRKVARLLPGLSLATVPAGRMRVRRGEAGATWLLPMAYVLLKPLFCTNEQLRRAGVIARDSSLPLPPEVAAHLAAGRLDDALRVAGRRLRMVGLGSRLPPVSGAGVDVRTLTAALMAPISDAALKALARLIQGKDEQENSRSGDDVS